MYGFLMSLGGSKELFLNLIGTNTENCQWFDMKDEEDPTK